MHFQNLNKKTAPVAEHTHQILQEGKDKLSGYLIVIGAISFISAYHIWGWLYSIGLRHAFYSFIAFGMACWGLYFKRKFKEGILGVFCDIVFWLFLFSLVDEIRHECTSFHINQYIIGILVIIWRIYIFLSKNPRNGKQ